MIICGGRDRSRLVPAQGEISTRGKVRRSGLPVDGLATNTTVQICSLITVWKGKYLQSGDLHFCPLLVDFSEAIGSEGLEGVKFYFDDSSMERLSK